LCLIPAVALATDVSVVGVIKGRAVLVIDGRAPRTLAIGETSPEGVKLLEADSASATVEVDGKRQTIGIGERMAVVSTASNTGPRQVVLYPDARGHFVTIGSVNGVPIKFLVDSGATLVSLTAADAKRAGVDYLQGRPGRSMTANGAIDAYAVKLASVKVGGIELKNVEGSVSEAPMEGALLGMSFLSRLSMQRDGQHLILAQRDAGSAAAAAPAEKSGRASVTMKVRQGHFYTAGSINGSSVNFMVDTGASTVSISVADARRMGINYLAGTPAYSNTANGIAPIYLVKFDEVQVGDILLRNVDGAVIDGAGMPMALLGMSFLSRTDIKRDGDSMSLTRRF
jgi:aspartyl protease family protein